MPKDVFVMRAPQPEPQWDWARWLRATETELAPTPLLLFVRDRFDAMEAALRAARDRSGEHYAGPFWDECDALLAEIDAAKAGG